MVFLSPECRYMHRFFATLRNKPIRKETHTHKITLPLFSAYAMAASIFRHVF